MLARRVIAAIGAAIAALVIGCGCGGGVDRAPVISDATVNPAELGYLGGNVTITATVTDDREVTAVSATVTGPGGTAPPVNMTLAGDHYEGVYEAAGNATIAGQDYAVTVDATDNAGQTTMSAALGFTVKAAAGPPDDLPW